MVWDWEMLTNIQRSMWQSTVQTSMSLCSIPMITVFNPSWRVDHALNCVKGGGACHLREKVLAEAAKTCEILFSNTMTSFMVFSDLFLLLTIGKTWNSWAQMFVGLSFVHSSADLDAVYARCADWSRTLRLCKGTAKSSQPWITESDTSNGRKERSALFFVTEHTSPWFYSWSSSHRQRQLRNWCTIREGDVGSF